LTPASPLLITMFIISMTIALPAFSYQPPQLRLDLTQKLSLFLCEQDPTKVLPSQLWQQGVFDFDMTSYQIQAESGQWLSQSRVQKAAQTFAQQNHHGGYAFALCSQQKAWIITAPSQIPPVRRSEQAILFSLDAARLSCRSLAIDHASQHTSQVRRILQHSLGKKSEHSKYPNTSGPWLQINHHLLSTGFLTLTCLPKQSNLGPITWTMLPIFNKHQRLTEARKYPNSAEPKLILQWINQQRQEAGLASLQSNSPQLYQAAAALSQHNLTVHHQRPHLRKIRDHLAPQGFRLIGENRVRAGSPSLLAWLLWNSPRHRSLLLNPKATHIGINIRHIDQEKLLVLVLGEQTDTNKKLPPIVRRTEPQAKSL